jgi:hypothetical protein
MKILELNGKRYSRDSFDGYKLRAKVKLTTTPEPPLRKPRVEDEHFLDVYTDDEDKANVEKILQERKSERVTSLEVIHWATKAQDDASAALIDELNW